MFHEETIEKGDQGTGTFQETGQHIGANISRNVATPRIKGKRGERSTGSYKEKIMCFEENSAIFPGTGSS